MAESESDSGQERTEEPTPRRLQKAREEGRTARSRELTTTFILLTGLGSLMVFGPRLSDALWGLMYFSFHVPREAAFDTGFMVRHFHDSVLAAGWAFLPVFLLLLIAGLVGPVCLGGLLLSAKAITPKASRLNPLSGLKRMFSMNALMELGKALAKFAVVASIAIFVLYTLQPYLFALGSGTVQSSTVDALRLAGWSLLAVSAGLILIALVDVPYQIYDHNKKLKMTRQEVKDEYKDSEGKPEVKGRIRQLQREMARRRMMQAVPEADVVITNPEHFAVALRYRSGMDGAPTLVASGVDHTALKIREIAAAHEVSILSAPVLARAIYYTTELEQQIPPGLYLAVAQVLAYVFQLKNARAGKGRAPKPLAELPVPTELHFDASGQRSVG